MLKSWIQNQDVGEIEIEEKYVSFVSTLRTDRYTTVRAPSQNVYWYLLVFAKDV